MVLVLAACTEQAKPSRDEKKPRSQIVVLVTDGVPDDEASRTSVEKTLSAEAATCVAPGCELVTFSLGEVNGAAGFDAVLSKSSSPNAVATNVGGTRMLGVKRSLTSFEVYGFATGGEGDLATGRALPLTIGPRMPAGAQTFALSNDCSELVEKSIEKHGQWWPYLHGAFGRTCDGAPHSKHVYASTVASTPTFAEGYTRVRYEFDRNTRALLSVNVTFEKWK